MAATWRATSFSAVKLERRVMKPSVEQYWAGFKRFHHNTRLLHAPQNRSSSRAKRPLLLNPMERQLVVPKVGISLRVVITTVDTLKRQTGMFCILPLPQQFIRWESSGQGLCKINVPGDQVLTSVWKPWKIFRSIELKTKLSINDLSVTNMTIAGTIWSFLLYFWVNKRTLGA